MYSFVPTQPVDQEWTDDELYAKYGITDGARSPSSSQMVRPMEP